jgi:phage virion morphogenesis protein
VNSFRIEYENKDLNTVLDRLILRNTKLRPLYAEISNALLLSTKRRFQTETDPQGIPWAPLKPETLARKKTDKKLREALRLYNTLRVDFSSEFGGVSAGGPGVPYAAIHQLGGTPDMAPGPAAVVAREYLGFSDDDVKEIMSIAIDYESDAIRGA